jgi:hypothetical protein
MTANPWTPSARVHEPMQIGEPVRDSSAWDPEALRGTDVWVYRLSEAEIDEIHDAVARVEAEGGEFMDITRESFALPGLAAALADIKAEIRDGRGMALIRGLPTEDRSRWQLAAAFWGLGCHVGTAKSQNGRGHLLGHVLDLAGKGFKTPKVRGYMNGSALEFHTDRTDILSLCCLAPAMTGGEHRIASSATAYNAMLERRPDLVQELTFHFYRTRNGEIPVGETKPYIRQPVFSAKDGYFTGRSSGTKVMQAQDLPGVPKLTDAQLEANALYLRLAQELSLDMELEAGDITYVNCHVTLHARTDFEDWPEPERKRHLLRLWLNDTEAQRPLEESVAREVNAGVVVDGMAYKTPLEPAEEGEQNLA